MEIRKEIRKILSEIFLNEYISQDEIYLKDYFSMSEKSKKAYLPHEYHYFFDDFISEEDIDFQTPREIVQTNYADEPEEEIDMFDNTDELMTWLENNDKETYNAFADYLYKKITHNKLPIPESDYPAWAYFDDNPVIVKNQWLIHFTDNAADVALGGFKYGVSEMEKLGLTTHLGEFDKKYGGYNFAYLLSDFSKYAPGGHRNTGYKYGKEAVIFRASGIKVWHHSDEEPQVIFYGNTATNIIPITEGEDLKWSIRNKNNRILFESDELENIVSWLVKNYDQYRKSLSENLSENIVSEDYPQSFSLEEFKSINSFAGKIKYCEERLQRISSGSSRIAYKIDEEKVLKIAKNKKGIAQNEHEASQSEDYLLDNIVANIFDYDEDYFWIEMELAKKVALSDFNRITGFSFQDYSIVMNNHHVSMDNRNKGYKRDISPEIVEQMWESEFTYSMLDYLGSYMAPIGDLLKLNSYGIVNRNGHETIVLIDFGVNEEIMNKYYA